MRNRHNASFKENASNVPKGSSRGLFFALGVAMATWAPMVPYVKGRLHLDASQLGALLLCLGAGALPAMPATALVLKRITPHTVLYCTISASCLLLAMLSITSGALPCGFELLLFGASIASWDVTANAHALELERNSGIQVMSGFHGFYSLGGLAGAGAMSLLLRLGVPLLICAVMSALTIAVIGISAISKIPQLPVQEEKQSSKHLFWLTPSIFLIGILCFIAFMTEGAMLDWSAVFLVADRSFPRSISGTGYAVFSVGMALSRFSVEKMSLRVMPFTLLLISSTLASLGLFVAVLSISKAASLIGFLFVGLGLANVIPILFSTVGREQKNRDSAALSFIITLGYIGILVGPAFIGFLASRTTLPVTLACVAVMLLIVAICSPIAKQDTSC